MTSRADLPRLGTTLTILGELIHDKGQTVWDTMDGWQFGPRKAPQHGITGGGPAEGQEDRKDESIQRARAARHFQEFRADLNALEQLTQAVLRRIDVAMPPNTEEVKNRKTRDLDPMTPADVAAAGWCASCWRNDQQMVAREKAKKTGLYYSATLCRWCLGVKSTYGIEPPVEMLKLHHAGRRINVTDLEAAVRAELDKQPKTKKQKRRTKKAA